MLESIQKQFGSFIIKLLWLHIPLLLVAAFAVGNTDKLVGTVLLAVLLSAVPTYFYQTRQMETFRYLSTASYMLMVGLLVFIFRGHPWQIDIHMYFFAALAITAAFCDWRVILVAAGVTAAHHILFNLIVPAWVFPDGGSFARVVVHAVVLIFQTVALTWLVHRIQAATVEADRAQGAMVAADEAQKAFAEAEEEKQRAQEALHEAEMAKIETEKLQQQAIEEAEKNAQKMHQQRLALADQVEGSISQIVDDIAAVVTSLSAQADQMSQVSATTHEKLDVARMSSQMVFDSVSEMAGNAQDISSAMSDVSTKVQSNNGLAGEAGQHAAESKRSISDLVDQANKVSSVLQMINDISEQTNLLALNATIEAARAGEAGRGFAVVASEVKHLAGESAKAVEEIATLVSNIKNSSEETIAVNDKVVTLIERIGQTSSQVHQSVIDQSEATISIATMAKQATEDTQNASDSVKNMDALVGDVSQSSVETNEAAQVLSDKSRILTETLATLLSTIRQENASISHVMAAE